MENVVQGETYLDTFLFRPFRFNRFKSHGRREECFQETCLKTIMIFEIAFDDISFYTFKVCVKSIFILLAHFAIFVVNNSPQSTKKMCLPS